FGDPATAVPASLSPRRVVLTSLAIVAPRPAPSVGWNRDQAPSTSRSNCRPSRASLQYKISMARKGNVIGRTQWDLISRKSNVWLFAMGQRIVIHIFATALDPRCYALKARRRFLQPRSENGVF